MTEQYFWRLFVATGSPEAYVLFRRTENARREAADVSQDPGAGAPYNGI